MGSTFVTEGKASTLSTPQKVLAALLSIILVVGLSPLTQMPTQAYAKDAPKIDISKTYDSDKGKVSYTLFIGDQTSADKTYSTPYTGKEIKPTVTLVEVTEAENGTKTYWDVAGNKEIKAQFNRPEPEITPNLEWADNTNAGTAKVTYKATAGNYTGELTRTFTITKATQKVTATADKTSLTVGATAQITAKGEGAITYKASNDTVTVDNNGKVTAVKAGKATVTVDAAGNNNYEAAQATIDFTVTAAAVPAKPAKAKNTTFKVTVVKNQFKAKSTKKKVLKKNKVFKVKNVKGSKVTFAKANKAGKNKIVVGKKGKITVKKGLKAKTYKVKVKVTAKATATYKAASKTVGVNIKVTK